MGEGKGEGVIWATVAVGEGEEVIGVKEEVGTTWMGGEVGDTEPPSIHAGYGHDGVGESVGEGKAWMDNDDDDDDGNDKY